MPKKDKTPRRVMDDPAMRESFAMFKAKYPDIVGDKTLFELADNMTISLQEKHPDWSLHNIMDEAGKLTRKYLSHSLKNEERNRQLGAQAAPPRNDMADAFNYGLGGSLGGFGSGIRAGKTAQHEAAWKRAQFEAERDHRKRAQQQYRNAPMSTGQSVQQRILSRPVPVHWAGWETDTTRLQRAGWQLAVEFEPSRDMYSLMLKHPEMNMMALTSAIRLDHGLAMMDRYAMRDMRDPSVGVNSVVPFNVIKVAPQFENVRIQSTGTWKNFQLIDAEPQITESVIERPEDLNIFALAMTQAEQVAIDQADMSVVEHLEAIKDLQSDEQKDLREKARKREARHEGENAVTGEVIVQLVDYKH